MAHSKGIEFNVVSSGLAASARNGNVCVGTKHVSAHNFDQMPRLVAALQLACARWQAGAWAVCRPFIDVLRRASCAEGPRPGEARTDFFVPVRERWAPPLLPACGGRLRRRPLAGRQSTCFGLFLAPSAPEQRTSSARQAHLCRARPEPRFVPVRQPSAPSPSRLRTRSQS